MIMNQEHQPNELNYNRDSGFKTLMLFRCTKRKYAKDFMSGRIYFGCPKNWIDIEKKGKKGQGDILEGVFFATSMGSNNDDTISEKSLDEFEHNGFKFFRRKKVLYLPALCLYGLHNTAFHKSIADDGRAHYKASITKNYFESFDDYKTGEERSDDNADQPVVLLIHDPVVLFNRIIDSLRSLGVRENEILISPVKYINMYDNMIIDFPFPMELFVKDKAFEEQSEVRIVINSSCPEFLEYMAEHNNTIQIETIEDIAEMWEYYYEDMTIERIGHKKAIISLPRPMEKTTDEMSFLELIDLLYSIMGGSVTLKYCPQEYKTWQERVSFIDDLLNKKYNVRLFVDENKNVSFYNLSSELTDLLKKHDAKPITISQFEKEINAHIAGNELRLAREKCSKACSDTILLGAAHYFLGILNRLENNTQDAMNEFFISFLNDYKRIESLNGMAEILFEKGEYEKAIKVYEAIQDEKGYDCRIWSNIGVCYNMMGQYYKAIEMFNKGIALSPNDGFPYYNKGVSFFHLKQYTNAKINMEKAVELDPENEVYTRELQRFLASGFI